MTYFCLLSFIVIKKFINNLTFFLKFKNLKKFSGFGHFKMSILRFTNPLLKFENDKNGYFHFVTINHHIFEKTKK